MSDFVLDAENIHTWYGSSHVLHGIDLQLGYGETLGLLGRNGMGKSTLIRTIMGHCREREGRITLFGLDHSHSKPHQVARAGVAYVPEGRGVFPNLSVRENLIMAAQKPREEVSSKAEWTYERVLGVFPRLAERIKNMGNQLSGGGSNKCSPLAAPC